MILVTLVRTRTPICGLRGRAARLIIVLVLRFNIIWARFKFLVTLVPRPRSRSRTRTRTARAMRFVATLVNSFNTIFCCCLVPTCPAAICQCTAVTRVTRLSRPTRAPAVVSGVVLRVTVFTSAAAIATAASAARNIWSAAPTAVACYTTRCLVLGQAYHLGKHLGPQNSRCFAGRRRCSKSPIHNRYGACKSGPKFSVLCSQCRVHCLQSRVTRVLTRSGVLSVRPTYPVFYVGNYQRYGLPKRA